MKVNCGGNKQFKPTRRWFALLSNRSLCIMLKTHRVCGFAVAALALLLSWPAAAQRPVPATILCDADFPISNWSLTIFSSVTGSSVLRPGTEVVTQAPTGGRTDVYSLPGTPPCDAHTRASYLDVVDTLPTVRIVPGHAVGVVMGIHIFQPYTYNPATSGPIGTINVPVSYECPDSMGAVGSCQTVQTFGPAIKQNGSYYIAPAFPNPGVQQPWAEYASNAYTATQFCGVVSDTGATDCARYPDFSVRGQPIQCGFFTTSTSSSLLIRTVNPVHAGYDNWNCVISPPTGYLEVCMVAGRGIEPDTPFQFTVTLPSGAVIYPPSTVNAGSCSAGMSLTPGRVIINEGHFLPIGISMISSTTIPSSAQGPVNLTTGTSTVTIVQNVATATRVYITNER